MSRMFGMSEGLTCSWCLESALCVYSSNMTATDVLDCTDLISRRQSLHVIMLRHLQAHGESSTKKAMSNYQSRFIAARPSKHKQTSLLFQPATMLVVHGISNEDGEFNHDHYSWTSTNRGRLMYEYVDSMRKSGPLEDDDDEDIIITRKHTG